MEKDSSNQASQGNADQTPPQGKPERTLGLKAFDAFLYPGVTNVGVFATSVFFTYLTNRGSQFGKAGSIKRQFGELMEQRGDLLKNQLMRTGLSEGAAEGGKMVAWSFLDGSLLAPVIKQFEDNRVNIARKIDAMAGTTPDDQSVYSAEPKQSWGSVLGARALTAGIVVPTAMALEKVHFGKRNLNQIMFYDPGLELGQAFRELAPNFSSKVNEGTYREFSKVMLFEGFYTSVCTAGQYFISRFLASHRKSPASPTGQPLDAYGNAQGANQQQPLRLSALLNDDTRSKTPDTTVQEADKPQRMQEAPHAQIA